MLVGIAQHESGLDPLATHKNTNGSVDYGLMQVNSANFVWLGLTPVTALDPCVSIRAGAAVLTHLSAYNTGSLSLGITNGYVQKVVAAIDNVRSVPSAPIVATPSAKPTQPTIHLHNQIASFSR